MILYIDACVRRESRTRRLADRLVRRLAAEREEDCVRVSLDGMLFDEMNEDFLEYRDRMAREGAAVPALEWARQFASADAVVIAAPYWDLSFPAVLKQYLEQVNVCGVTFRYTPEGFPESLCRAKELWYVTTAGGPILSDEPGFGYVRALAAGFYQIPRIEQIRAEGLDIVGADVEAILHAAEEQIDRLELAEE